MANNEEKNTPENLVQLSPDSKPTNNANDLNKRINNLESTLTELKKQLKTSQDSVKQALTAGDASQEVKNQITDTLKQLAILDKNHKDLVKNTAALSEEGKKIAVRLTTNTGKQTKAIHAIEIKLLDELESRLQDLSEDLHSRMQDTRQSLDTIKTHLNQDIQQAVQASENRDQELTRRSDDVSEATIKLANTLDIMSQELTANIDEISHLSEQRDNVINNDIQALSTTVGKNYHHLSLSINTLKQQTEEHHESITTQVTQLDQSLTQQHDNIEQLSQRTEKTEHKVAATTSTLAAQSSRIESLNLVDEKMSLRAQQLEVSTDKLDEQTVNLKNTADHLGQQTQSLLGSVAKLSEQTDSLNNTAEKHQLALSALSFKESRHYNAMKGSLVLLALLAAGGFLYERGLWQSNELKTQALQHSLNTQQLALENTHLKQATMQSALAQQTAQTQQLQEEINALKNKVHGVKDGVDTLDGRLVAMMPHRTFGGDNILHGAQWIKQQDPSKFAIMLTSVTNKQDMYDIANRYSYRLKEKLAYYTIEQQGAIHFVLIYGTFDSQQQAIRSIRNLPTPNYQQRPFILPMQQIQSYIQSTENF